MTDQTASKDIPAQIVQGDGEVHISFDRQVPAELVRNQVGECIAQTCDCCTPEFRQQVKGFRVDESGQGVHVHILGDVSADQVRKNMLSCAPKLKGDS